MGWSMAFDSRWSRDIGYGVPALCDHPDCDEVIDRGLAYVCADQEPRGGDGCGLYFCEKHLGFAQYPESTDEEDDPEPILSSCCERCRDGLQPYIPKPDIPQWTAFKMVDPSWRKWRKAQGFPEPTPDLFIKMNAYYKEQGWGEYVPESD